VTIETPSDDAPEIRGGQKIYLCLRGDDSTSAVLDALDRRNIRAAVFCDEAFLSEQGDLSRRIAATGHRIGLYVGAEDAASALEGLEACNEQLRRTTMEKTRLAFADGAGEETFRALRNAGFLCPRPALDADSLRTSRQVADLLQAVSQQQADSVILWLGGTVSRSGLNAFLNDALEAGDAFPALNETLLP
jgi:peptidoglycan/xylan/chitin deacetylase (PgdA/CDA1 family)